MVASVIDSHLRRSDDERWIDGKGLSMAKKVAGPNKVEQARRSMSSDHKAALARGRDQGRAVRRYLEALETSRPGRGRKRSLETLDRRLATIEAMLPSASPMDRLHLAQERLNLAAERSGLGGASVDIDALERGFAGAAAEYGARKGITYSAWREAGIPPAVLRKAGISRVG